MEFDDAINEHLELQRRNARLEHSLPIEHYRSELATKNQPGNPQPEAAEQTEDALPGWPAEDEREQSRNDDSRLWDIPPLFDWGD
jgi:hypothetical protein